MSTSIQSQNLRELLVVLRGMQTGKKKESPLSQELIALLDANLSSDDLPDTLRPSAAEAFQLAFEAWGGLPRLVLFADRYPGSFLKLYARQTVPTISPVLPQPVAAEVVDEWPAWMTMRRLAYQVAAPAPGEAPSEDDDA